MDAKSLHTLELAKILDRLSRYAAFSASTALALALTPTADPAEARRRQQQTTEARRLLTVKPDLTIGGARDVRPQAQSALIGGVLEPSELLDLKNTLVAARTMQRTLSRLAEVARVSKAGNDQHNPGQPLHWSRGKSTDFADTIARHLLERGAVDVDGQRHTAKAAWRILAMLQIEMEEALGKPISRGSKA
jgi:hypothetical protein